MKNKTKTLFALVSIGMLLILGCNTLSGNKNESSILDKKPAVSIQRGEYLVNAIGCDDCHSPKRMGAHGPELISELRLSGFPEKIQLPETDQKIVQKGWALFAPDLTAAVGPWGTTYAANITSDSTGIGSWKEENFLKSIREGVSKGITGNRPVLPPMPWYNLSKLNDDDLKSIYAYLKSVKPVHNVVPQPVFAQGPKH